MGDLTKPFPQVVMALREKRAEIAGYVHKLERQARDWRARLAHIDASIKLFSPRIDPEAIPPKLIYRRSRYFQRGEFTRLVLDYLREASAPKSAVEIATAILASKDVPADNGIVAHVGTKALGVLRAYLKRGIVERARAGKEAKWAISKGLVMTVAPKRAEGDTLGDRR